MCFLGFWLKELCLHCLIIKGKLLRWIGFENS
jgi:hypothetical protein